MNSIDQVLYHRKSFVTVGQIERYVITYSLTKRNGHHQSSMALTQSFLKSLWLKVKNVSKASYHAGYIMGPFDLYCDVTTGDYNNSEKLITTAEGPQYQSSLQPQSKIITELTLHQLKYKYVWIVDVVSGIIFSPNSHISYEITVGNSKGSLKIHSPGETIDPKLEIIKLTTDDLWRIPKSIELSNSPIDSHLVILTHGLHSNISVDMFYIMEEIYKRQYLYPNERIIVEGYTENVCQTEKGIKYLGTRLAEYIINDLYNDSIIKISFIGHSLGGLVQMFAIAYISIKYPWFFQKVIPINFITLASPLLGLASHNPKYVKYSLSYGVMGKTGQDLGLHREKLNNNIPLLYLLSGEPLTTILKLFSHRTIYANGINDGIVPLYTSALLYLDYKELLDKIQEVKQKKHELTKVPTASLLGSVSSLVMPPKPNSSYIKDPAERLNIIIHDKVYNEYDIGDIKNKYEDTILKPYLKKKVKELGESYQEAISNNLHKGMSWRKVIVALKPDAHNNIIVRRRFANAYGWPVIGHVLNTHFDGSVDSQTSSTEIDIDENQDFSWLVSPDNMNSCHGGILSSTTSMLDRRLNRQVKSKLELEQSTGSSESFQEISIAIQETVEIEEYRSTAS